MAFSQSNSIRFKSIEAKTNALLGAGGVMFDPDGAFAGMLLQKNAPTTIESGIVIRSGCGGYDCAVKIGMYEVPCTILSSQTSQGFGSSEGFIPVEGTEVWVLLRRGSYSTGWIVGAVPRANHLATNKEYIASPHFFYPNEDISPFADNYAYGVIYYDQTYSGKIWSNANRPCDVLPGEYVIENENHAGLLNSMYSVELSGGNSFIRIDRIDDEIRMRSTNFTKWTNAQAVSEFNDGGYISAEGRDYAYQGELLGGYGLSVDGYDLPSDSDKKEPRPRTRWWRGFLGNLLSWFVVRPRGSKEAEDTGLASVHASQAGNIMVRSAGGISLERYDRIPVPKRNKAPWNPSGDREKDIIHMPLRQFVCDDPHARALEHASRMAWEQASMYKRFDELKKDFSTQQEGDITGTMSNADGDPPGSSELDLSEYKGRRAGVFVGDDGSIILRDAWGSEVVMLGGNIFLNTPGNVITTANRDIVSIARQSAVIRGVSAAEMSSDESCVRIHAKKLVSIAGGTDTESGGVLIESLARSSSLNAGKNAGDKASIGGVVIRSESAGVAISGKSSYVIGKDRVLVSAGDSDKERNGDVFVSGRSVISSGKDTVASVCGSTGSYMAEDGYSLVSSGSVVVAGKQSAVIFNDDKVPKDWAPVDVKDLYDVLEVSQDISDNMQSSDMLSPFTWNKQVEKAVFSFRSSIEAKTNRGIEPWKPNDEFTLYQPWWQVMVASGDPMASGSPYKPKVGTVHDTACWPYKDSIYFGEFVKVDSPANVENGYSKSRGDLSDRESMERYGMSEFEV